MIATVHAFASIGWACLAAVLVSFAGYSPPEAGMRADTAAPASIAVITAAAVMEPMGIEIEAVGTTQANESVEVTAKASNVITAIRFAEGAEVSRGDVLVELDAAEARAALAEAQAALADSLLRAGMFMTVTLQGDVRPTLLVPEETIVPEQGRIYVFVVRGERAERREVRIGKRRPGDVEVVEGLVEGDLVVVEGTQNLRHGALVQEAARRPT